MFIQKGKVRPHTGEVTAAAISPAIMEALSNERICGFLINITNQKTFDINLFENCVYVKCVIGPSVLSTPRLSNVCLT